MQIYNVEPMQALVDMTKGLFTEIPIYKESMHEDVNDIPDSYILLRSQITDTTESYGDGKSVVRSADCDIMLVSKGYADDTDDLHNINKRKIREHLKAQGINFDEVNLGYNDSLKSTQHTFSVEVKYV
ncbi:MAG: hypothetical protein IKV81_06610 [Clostridia bacterium]|nr:hypothetical protein [Clostridia bacterium]